MKPDMPDAPAPLTILPREEVRSLDTARARRLRGATLLAGRKQQGTTLGSSIVGGAQPSVGGTS